MIKKKKIKFSIFIVTSARPGEGTDVYGTNKNLSPLMFCTILLKHSYTKYICAYPYSFKA